MTYDFFSQSTISYFQDKQWMANQCCKCHRVFLSKDPDDYCGSYDCFGPWEHNGTKSKPHNAHSVMIKMQHHFNKRGYITERLENVKNKNGDTALIVAALQYYNNLFAHSGQIDNRMLFCPQPCLRLRPFPDQYHQLGFLHAFVNTATLKLQASLFDFFVFLDDWISFFSSIGIHASKLRIVLCPSHVSIRSMYLGWGIDLNLSGLELGHCNFYDQVITSTGITTTGIDCGFSIERILWILNCGPFWNSLLPDDIIRHNIPVNLEFEDALRAATLIVMSGITPGPRNECYQLKKLLDCVISHNSEWLLIDANVDHYYFFWKAFLGEYVSLEDCKSVISHYLREKYLRLHEPAVSCNLQNSSHQPQE